MAKRGAATELNHENWNLDDDNEQPGTFARVKESELRNRVIRKAKRSLNSESSGSSPFQGSSPFAKFSGFPATSKPFVFSKKTDNTNEGSSSVTTESNNDTKKENGGSMDVHENKLQEVPQDVQKTDSNASMKTQSKPLRNIEYYHQLQSLNESVLKWMQLHLTKNPCCDFTPVFNDYTKHMDTLNFTYPVKKKEIAFLPEEKGNGCSPKPKVQDGSSQLKGSKCTSSNANSGFKMENTKHDDETDYGANFSATTTNTSSFSFGMKLTPTATSSRSPMGPTSSSKEEEKVPETKPFQFSFGGKSNTEDSGASKGFSFASAIASAKNAETVSTEEKYEPPKNDFVAVSEEDAIYSKRCKLFFKKGDGFADKGVGTLHLKSLEGKTQLLVRADTNLGNILLNIVLSASLPMSRTGKNNVLLVCIPNPPLDAKNPDSKEAIPMLIRVKTAEDADELLEILNKHKS